MRFVNDVVLSAADDVSRTGGAIDSNQLISASFQTIFGDVNAAGTVKIQASNDIYNAKYNFPQGLFVPTHWSDIASATATVTAGVCPLITLDQSKLCYRWLRVVFTSSGAGATTIVTTMFALSI